jgi:FAD/FMN-containing dehydrogenase
MVLPTLYFSYIIKNRNIHFLPEAIEDTRKTLDRMGMDGAIVGHVGDGNYHVILMIDMGKMKSGRLGVK